MRNTGNTRWLAAPERRDGHVALGGHLRDERGAVLEQDFLRVRFPAGIDPGAAAELECAFRMPERAGRYRLELDMVDEGVAWFASHGSPTLLLDLHVR